MPWIPRHINEQEEAVALAKRILDRPGSDDPDDHLAILSRQLLRARERIESLEALLADD